MSQRRPWRRDHPSGRGALDELLGPDLGGARPACAGTAPMFDLTVWGEPDAARRVRHAAAVELCRRCAVRAACERALWAEHRPAGVWAGQIIDPAARRAPDRADEI